MLCVNVSVQPEIEVDPQDPEDLNSFREKQDYFQKIGERKKNANSTKIEPKPCIFALVTPSGLAVEQQCKMYRYATTCPVSNKSMIGTP